MENEQYEVNELTHPIQDQSINPQSTSMRHLFIFIIGFLSVNIFATLISGITLKFIDYEGNEILVNAITNFTTYISVFILLVLLIAAFKLLTPIIKQFMQGKTYVNGLFWGFIVIIVGVLVGMLIDILFGKTESNQNQSSIEIIIRNHPLSSFMWIVLLGPISEEIIYRLGFFEGLRQRNRRLAYIVSAIFFGFIHFNIPIDTQGNIISEDLIREFLNLPSYIVSGLLFSYIYEKEGFGTSVVAHITNNLLSFVFTIISIYA